ncbi:hypothetical protein ACOME3_002086 [Neoechinorhynchus agilis]
MDRFSITRETPPPPSPSKQSFLGRFVDRVVPLVRVNCWFCNTDQYVQFSERKWFKCVQCDQYNGFRDDGDYRYRVPGMRDDKFVERYEYKCPITELNRHPVICRSCDINNHMRILQMARLDLSFRYEENCFRLKQFERDSELCPPCEEAVRDYIQRQDQRINQYNRQVSESRRSSTLPPSNVQNISKKKTMRRPNVFAEFVHLLRIIFCSLLLVQASDEYLNLGILGDLVNRFYTAVYAMIATLFLCTQRNSSFNDLWILAMSAAVAVLDYHRVYSYLSYWQRLVPSLILAYVSLVKSFTKIQ